MDLTKQFFKYVSQNIFGLLGTSCYILADTYFIAQAAGTDGVTLLNLCLPIYNFIFAIGSMIALGSATRYAIAKAQNEPGAAVFLQRYPVRRAGVYPVDAGGCLCARDAAAAHGR